MLVLGSLTMRTGWSRPTVEEHGNAEPESRTPGLHGCYWTSAWWEKKRVQKLGSHGWSEWLMHLGFLKTAWNGNHSLNFYFFLSIFFSLWVSKCWCKMIKETIFPGHSSHRSAGIPDAAGGPAALHSSRQKSKINFSSWNSKQYLGRLNINSHDWICRVFQGWHPYSCKMCPRILNDRKWSELGFGIP